MNLTDHFTLEELIISPTAVRLGIDNAPGMDALKNLFGTAKQMEAIRAILKDRPIIVFSGYRSKELNDAPETVKTGKHSVMRDVIAINMGRFHEHSGKPKFDWTETGKPAPATTYGKFYTIHLQDSSAEDRDVIERHMGMHVEFLEGGKVSWRPYGTEKKVA